MVETICAVKYCTSSKACLVTTSITLLSHNEQAYAYYVLYYHQSRIFSLTETTENISSSIANIWVFFVCCSKFKTFFAKMNDIELVLNYFVVGLIQFKFPE